MADPAQPFLSLTDSSCKLKQTRSGQLAGASGFRIKGCSGKLLLAITVDDLHSPLSPKPGWRVPYLYTARLSASSWAWGSMGALGTGVLAVAEGAEMWTAWALEGGWVVAVICREKKEEGRLGGVGGLPWSVLSLEESVWATEPDERDVYPYAFATADSKAVFSFSLNEYVLEINLVTREWMPNTL